MFVAIILGYALAAIFALCGIFNCAAYCLDGSQGSDASSFLNGLVTAAMPLLYATILLLLIQVCTQLERMGIQTEISLLKGTAAKNTAKTKAPKAHGTTYIPKSEKPRRTHEPRYFVTHEEQTTPSPVANGAESQAAPQHQQAAHPMPEPSHFHPGPQESGPQFFRTN